jgi:hypothetical protein
VLLFSQHHSVSIPDILLKLTKGAALAEDARDLKETAHEP